MRSSQLLGSSDSLGKALARCTIAVLIQSMGIAGGSALGFKEELGFGLCREVAAILICAGRNAVVRGSSAVRVHGLRGIIRDRRDAERCIRTTAILPETGFLLDSSLLRRPDSIHVFHIRGVGVEHGVAFTDQQLIEKVGSAIVTFEPDIPKHPPEAVTVADVPFEVHRRAWRQDALSELCGFRPVALDRIVGIARFGRIDEDQPE